MEQHSPKRFASDPRLERLTTLASDVHKVISPLAFTPKVPYDRRFIYAGLADRLVHPVRQVDTLWRHWGQPEIEWVSGGHVGTFLSRSVHEFLERSLRSSEMLPDLTRHNEWGRERHELRCRRRRQAARVDVR